MSLFARSSRDQRHVPFAGSDSTATGGSRRRLVRLPLLGFALIGLIVFLTGCSGLKPESLSVTQPGDVGPIQASATLCTLAGSPPVCGPPEGTNEAQLLIGYYVPVGTVMPETIAGTPSAGAATTPTVFTRDTQVGKALEEEEATENAKPGFELVGYRSGVVAETTAEEGDWSVAPSLELPQEGNLYAKSFELTAYTAWQVVNAEHTAGRPLDCKETAQNEEDPVTYCGDSQSATLEASSLTIAAPSETTAVAGTSATLQFGLSFASSSKTPPSFALAATSTLSGAGVTLLEEAYEPGTLDESGDAAPATRTATVQVPAGAIPGPYEVTLTATTPSGGIVTQSAKLLVTAAPVAPVAASSAPTAATTTDSAPVVAIAPIKCVVPYMGGKTLATVKRLLAASHCALGKVDTGHRNARPKGELVEQNYHQGTFLPAGAKVSIWLSRGH